MLPFPAVSEIFLNVFYLVPFSGGEWINTVFWTLGIELQFYLLCAFIFGLKRSRFTDAGMYALPLLSVFLAGQSSNMFVLYWLDFFIAGGFIAMYHHEASITGKDGVVAHSVSIVGHIQSRISYGHHSYSYFSDHLVHAEPEWRECSSVSRKPIVFVVPHSPPCWNHIRQWCHAIFRIRESMDSLVDCHLCRFSFHWCSAGSFQMGRGSDHALVEVSPSEAMT